MEIELPEKLEVALKMQADACGISPADYVRRVLERGLETPQVSEPSGPFKTGLGMWAKYGRSLSAEDIDDNRGDMVRSIGEVS